MKQGHAEEEPRVDSGPGSLGGASVVVQPGLLAPEPGIHPAISSSIHLRNLNEVIAMRENQIEREGEEEDNDEEGEDTQTERGHQTRSLLQATQRPPGAWC